MTDTTGSEMVKATNFSPEELRNIETFADAVELYRQKAGEEAYVASEELGDGFALMKDKDNLIGRPLFFVSWTFKAGDYENDEGEKQEFVTARVVVHDGGQAHKVVIVDGGSGICAQLRQFTNLHNGATSGLIAENGLRRSDFTYTDEKGKNTPASTYYISTDR